jgi:NADH-quinone oxidoreductase subunit J
MDGMLFLTFAAIAVGCGINLVLQRHPINSAISLVGVMGSLAVLYLLLGGEFIAAVQLIVYAGAIMVLFVFVIMLLNTGAEARPKRKVLAWYLSLPLLFLFIGVCAWLLLTQGPSSEIVRFGAFGGGGAKEIGLSLFTKYLLPFQITAVLVLVAILGAVVLARKEI